MSAINKINVNGVTYDILGLPVGTIFTSALPQTNSGVHLLDGGYIATNGIYSDFCKLVKKLIEDGYNLLCSEEEFNSDVAEYGQCGKFVLDEENNTLRLPLITEFIASNNGGQEIGLAQLDEFKSHEHKIKQRQQWYSKDIVMNSSTGSIYNWRAKEGGTTYSSYQDPDNDILATGGEETRPKNIRYPYYIVLATVKQTDIEVNIDNVVNDLNNKADKLDIFNIMPDYSRTQVKELDVEHIAESNGYLFGQLNGYSSANALLTIDGVQVARGIVWTGNVLSSYMVPIGKHSIYKLTGGYRGDNGTKLNFVPCKGN